MSNFVEDNIGKYYYYSDIKRANIMSIDVKLILTIEPYVLYNKTKELITIHNI